MVGIYNTVYMPCHKPRHTFNPPEDHHLKSFFFNLFHPQLATSSGVQRSRGDVFTADQEIYDFDGNLPSVVLNRIQTMLDEDNILQGSFPRYHFSIGPSLTLPAKSTSLSRPSDWSFMLNIAAHTAPSFMSQIYEYGRELVHDQEWKPQSIADLVCNICWKGSEPSVNTHPLSMALLAFSVHCHFRACDNLKSASLFENVLRDCVIGYLRRLWDAQAHVPVIQSGYNVSYPPVAYIQCANRFAAFSGCLYRCEVVNRETILQCLWILVDQLTTQEHLNAIHDLIACSDVYRRGDGGDENILLALRFAKAISEAIRARASLMLAAHAIHATHNTLNAIFYTVAQQSGCGVNQLHQIRAAFF
ncbi:hypothetical protein GYMLUDRAFT_79966 [Collybiopsis luxurians FD-317 M1]|nr:hypothetical protein GYMLUDRAFT_79966 [Collybiopsis luxurians FD-317 M1]